MLTRIHTVVAVMLLSLCSGALAQSEPAAKDNIGHERHMHRHGDAHPTEAPTPARFVTSRRSDVVLPLPQEKDAFTFVVFGDRTGGPADGVGVLADAVRDTNLIEPDLVMTVGDLVQGYNTADVWKAQMQEFRSIMDKLACPWFPVAGNHDVYWRGPGKPAGEHEADYEMYFGPLWYAFKHKNCWFIALYSDEGNAQTGEKDFNKPEAQKMSQEQFDWLKGTLARAHDADHVFLFLHHPRWTGGKYGDDWDKVHKELVAAGNVTAVFAGHIHHMRSDPKDGIEYVTLATVGGAQDGKVADAGWLHHFNIITVRKAQVAMASIPVGEVMDVREITGELAQECARMTDARPVVEGVVRFAADQSASDTVKVRVANPTSREADVTVMLDSADSRWVVSPDHRHARVGAGETGEFEFVVARPAGAADAWVRSVEAAVDADVLMPGHRYALPTRRVRVPLSLEGLPTPPAPAHDLAAAFDGDDALRVESGAIEFPDGPFTLECWMNADAFGPRTGLLCKTESSEYGIFVNNARPTFSVYLDNGYVEAKAPREALSVGRWHHVAGVFDGEEVRLYVDGVKVAATKGKGKRKTSTRPLMIGADVGGDGSANSFFSGRIDSVRLTRGAVYTGERFEPVRRLVAQTETVLLANMDAFMAGGAWLEAPRGNVAEVIGMPRLVGAE